MLRKLLLVAVIGCAMHTLVACCCPASACGSLCNAIPTGILMVQAPAPTDTALVSTQSSMIEEQSTCTADNPMPF